MPVTFEEIHCNICGSTSASVFLQMEDYRYQKCNECGLIFQNPRPVFNELKKKKDSFLLPRIQEYNKLAVSLKLSTNEQDLLKRAQGFMWAFFYVDKDFEKMLVDCYQLKAEFMPFEIVIE